MLSAPPGVKVLRSAISELISHRHELILLVANLLCPLSLAFETIILVMSTDTVLKLTLFSCNCSDIFVSALDSESGGLGSSPGQGPCVVFLGKTLYSHSASLHPGVQMGTSKCAGGNPAMD